MREHMGLYRGKRLCNGKWMEGYLLRCEDGTCFICQAGYRINRYKVDPDTVGECTGLRDKNGKLIFEGDIVEGCDFTAEDGYGVVDFDDGSFTVSGNGFEGTFHENYWGLDLEIIGNIHDNPELLKGGDGDG